MDENVNSEIQEEMSHHLPIVTDDIPRFWKATKLLLKGLLYFFLLFFFYLIIQHFFHFSITILDVSFYICGLFILFLIFKWVSRLGYSLEKTFGLFTLPTRNIYTIFFIGIGLYLFNGSAGGLIKSILDKIGYNSSLPNPNFPNEWWNLIIRIISMIVLAPIIEELIFRGIILKSLSKSVITTWAIVISSLLFGIMHIHLVYIIVISLSFMITAWIVIKTNSILSGIIIHFVNNSFAASYYFLNSSGLLTYLHNLNLAVKWIISIFILISSIMMIILGINWLLRNLNLSSQRPITFISDYFRRKYEINPLPPPTPEVIEQ